MSPTTWRCCRCWRGGEKPRGGRKGREGAPPPSCGTHPAPRPPRPPVILADEPTAPLDGERTMVVIRILNDMASKFETAIIVVTHDEKIIPTFKRIYHIRDGVTHEEAGEGRDLGL